MLCFVFISIILGTKKTVNFGKFTIDGTKDILGKKRPTEPRERERGGC